MKLTKRILCLLTAILLCFSLTACNELDEMRATHAIRQEDGTILWNGHTYRALEHNYDFYNLKSNRTVYVTDPEVPLLFSRIEGIYHSASANGLLISGGNYAEDTVFCREDHYEWMTEAAQNEFVPASYFCEIWQEEKGDFAELFLSQEERQTVDRWLSLPSFEADAGEWMHCFTIYGYSEYNLLVKFVCSVMWDGSSYVLCEEGDNVEPTYYRVPESEWAMLDELNGGRPEKFVINEVEEGPVYTTQTSVRTMVPTEVTATTTNPTTDTTEPTTKKPIGTGGTVPTQPPQLIVP